MNKQAVWRGTRRPSIAFLHALEMRPAIGSRASTLVRQRFQQSQMQLNGFSHQWFEKQAATLLLSCSLSLPRGPVVQLSPLSVV